MSAVLYSDMGPPYVVRARVGASAEFDPLTASDTKLICRKPSGAEVTWETTEVTKDETQLVVSHALVDDELDEVGHWTVNAQSTVPGGAMRTECVGFWVRAPRSSREQR